MLNGFWNHFKKDKNTGSLEGFLQYFQIRAQLSYSGDLYQDFVNQLGGRQFGNGIFSSFRSEELELWRNNISEAFPELGGNFRPFGYDWQGNCFAVAKDTNGNERILFIEIGDGKIYPLSFSFAEFMNVEIPKNAAVIFEKSMYDEWRVYAKTIIPYGNCAGYIVPLFLGGEATPKNMEISDMEVYWSILGQIRTQI